jgi:hypothetical protein
VLEYPLRFVHFVDIPFSCFCLHCRGERDNSNTTALSMSQGLLEGFQKGVELASAFSKVWIARHQMQVDNLPRPQRFEALLEEPALPFLSPFSAFIELLFSS